MSTTLKRHSCVVRVDDVFLWQKVVCSMQTHSELLEKCGTFYNKGRPWIYRGQSFEGWNIKSSFERSLGKTRWSDESEDSKKAFEDRCVEEFKSRARLLGVHGELDDTEWLSYMQHYGCPTRLIDFTIVPMVALYHAIYGLDAKLDFSVYALSRNHILGVEYQNDKYQDEPVKITDCSEDEGYDIDNARQITNYVINPRQNHKPTDDTEAPILCVIPRSQNKRLNAQSGLFLMQRKLQGSVEDDLGNMMEVNSRIELSLDEFAQRMKDDGFYDGLRFVKFVFDRNLRKDAKSLLHCSGVIHRMMYPDFEGIAKSVKEDVVYSDKSCCVETVPLKEKPGKHMPLVMPESKIACAANREVV